MIAFALTGKRDEVLAEFNKVTGTEKKDAEHIEAIRKEVAAKVGELPDTVTDIGLNVQARPTAADKLGLEIFVHAI